MIDKPKLKENDLDKIKEIYSKLKIKHNLPEFSYLNENFEIENILVYDTELLLKKIRKQICEKIYYFMRILEAFLNPSNSPLFVFNIIKSINESDKELISSLYKKFGDFEILSFNLEINYSEEKEAGFINSFCSFWKQINPDLVKIFGSIKSSNNKEFKKFEKSYFG